MQLSGKCENRTDYQYQEHVLYTSETYPLCTEYTLYGSGSIQVLLLTLVADANCGDLQLTENI